MSAEMRRPYPMQRSPSCRASGLGLHLVHDLAAGGSRFHSFFQFRLSCKGHYAYLNAIPQLNPNSYDRLYHRQLAGLRSNARLSRSVGWHEAIFYGFGVVVLTQLVFCRLAGFPEDEFVV